jgi:hypothetical protein
MGWRDWFGVSSTIDVFAHELIRLAAETGSTGWIYDSAECLLHKERNELTVKAEGLETLSLGITYQEQKTALKKYYDRSGDNVFVATFSLYSAPWDRQAVVSGAAWTEGIVSILPRTDMITFVRAPPGPDAESLLVRWADVKRICAHLLRKIDEDPDRYRVETFPTGDTWQQLKSVEIQAA